MKLSKYNVYIPLAETGRTAIYNTWSGRYCVLPKAIGTLVEARRNRGSMPGGVAALLGQCGDLLKAGILVPDARTEQTRFEKTHDQMKFAADYLKILAVLTLQCNFRCHYCFQGGRKFAATFMKPATARSIVNFVDGQLERKQPKAMIVGLYGGEPLLAPAVGNLLVDGVSRLTDNRDIHVEFSLTTNGYRIVELFDMPIVQRCTSVHLTLDGDRELHDSTRFTRSGKPSYDRILQGLRMLLDAKKRVNVRIHSTRIDPVHLRHILDDLLSAGITADSGTMLYLMQLEKSCSARNKRCGSQDSQEVIAQFRRTMELLDAVSGHPLAPLLYRQFHAPTSPLPVRAVACEYENSSTFTINWDGRLMVCPRLGGESCVLGRITPDGQVAGNNRYQRMLQGVRHSNAACRFCEYLPVCGGKCLLKPKPKTLEDCQESRTVFHDMVERYVRHQESVGALNG